MSLQLKVSYFNLIECFLRWTASLDQRALEDYWPKDGLELDQLLT